MVTNCPSCAARFKLNKDKFGGKQVTLKCVQCQKVFQVDVPLNGTKLSANDTEIKVLVAHSDQNLCEMIRDIVGQDGMSCRISQDGEGALRMMQSDPPNVAVVDVALPGLYAFEVVEKVRSRPGLENVKIILLSSVYNKMAYKRTPASLYGADDYIEKHHIPNDLVPYINRLVSGAHRAPVSPETVRDELVAAEAPSAEKERQVREFTDEMNSKIQQAEEQEVSATAASDKLEKARRLARNIVSDIALYNQDKVEEGVQSGTFYELLADEIREGKRLFNERFTPESCDGVDVLKQEFDTFIDKRRAELAQ